MAAPAAMLNRRMAAMMGLCEDHAQFERLQFKQQFIRTVGHNVARNAGTGRGQSQTRTLDSLR